MKNLKVYSFKSNKLISFMLALFLMFTLLLMFILTATPIQAFAVTKPIGTLHGKVTNVVDGDAFVIKTLDNQKLTIKIAGIDTTPNPDAYTFLKSFLQGKNVKVEIISIATTNIQPFNYGVVYIDNTDISKLILQSGLAEYEPTTISSTYKNRYIGYENEAKYNYEGIWNY